MSSRVCNLLARAPLLALVTAGTFACAGEKSDATPAPWSSDSVPPGDTPAKWVGWRFVDLPQQAQLLNSDTLSVRDTVFRVDFFRLQGADILWLARGRGSGENGAAVWVVLAAAAVQSGAGEKVLIGNCRLDGDRDRALVAVARNEDVPVLKHVRRALRANTSRGTFDSVATRGIECVNEDLETNGTRDSAAADRRPPFRSPERAVTVLLDRSHGTEMLSLRRCVEPDRISCEGGIEILDEPIARSIEIRSDTAVVEIRSRVTARLVQSATGLDVLIVSPPTSVVDTVRVPRAREGDGWGEPIMKGEDRIRSTPTAVRTRLLTALGFFHLRASEKSKLDGLVRR